VVPQHRPKKRHRSLIRFQPREAEEEAEEAETPAENIVLQPRTLGLNLDNLTHGTNKKVVSYYMDEPNEDGVQRCRTAVRTRETIMGEDQGCLGCFACTHVGESSPSIQDSNMQTVINRLYDFDTTDIVQHAVDLSAQYESLVRGPANKKARVGDELLPPWNPATIISHIYYHNNDMNITVKLMIHKLKNTAIYMVNQQILKATIYPTLMGHYVDPNEGEPIGTMGNVWIDKHALKGVNDTVNNLIKLSKLDTRRLVPNSIRSNALVALNVNKTAVLDPTKKKVVSMGNHAGSLDRYFHKETLALRNGGTYLPAAATGPAPPSTNNAEHEYTETDQIIDLINDGGRARGGGDASTTTQSMGKKSKTLSAKSTGLNAF